MVTQRRLVRVLLCAHVLLLSCGRIGFSFTDSPDVGQVGADMVCSDDTALDADGDGRCDADDMCAGSDDRQDADGDGIPDGCDACGDGLVDISIGETCDPATVPNSCPTDCDDADPCTEDLLHGSALRCDASCSNIAITEPSNGDGCCPEAANNTNDAECVALCGNGVVEAGESCEPAPATTLRCPTSCDDGDACMLDEMRGDPGHCDVVCAHEPITEQVDGDGCCPPGADSATDSDCPPLCGNGSLEPNETCDPGSAATACPLSCDDGEVCTLDSLSGAPQTCNVVCSNQPITMPFNEDGCCPAGANSNNDSDCAPACGNAVVEAGEQCDGGAGCSNCMLTLEGECLAMLSNDACSQCGCAMCTTDMMNCYRNGDSQRDLRCPPVVECALAQQCTGTCGSPYYCYGEFCWGAGNPPPNGPCKTPISAAAGGATTTNQVGPRSQNSSYPLYWSEQYGKCLLARCPNQCNL